MTLQFLHRVSKWIGLVRGQNVGLGKCQGSHPQTQPSLEISVTSCCKIHASSGSYFYNKSVSFEKDCLFHSFSWSSMSEMCWGFNFLFSCHSHCSNLLSSFLSCISPRWPGPPITQYFISSSFEAALHDGSGRWSLAKFAHHWTSERDTSISRSRVNHCAMGITWKR